MVCIAIILYYNDIQPSVYMAMLIILGALQIGIIEEILNKIIWKVYS